MQVPVKYTVPLALLKCHKGHLLELRQHLESIGYPLASNVELNCPDSVIRLQDGYHIVNSEVIGDHKVYHVARIEVTE